jgi:hypothetical protein
MLLKSAILSKVMAFKKFGVANQVEIFGMKVARRRQVQAGSSKVPGER